MVLSSICKPLYETCQIIFLNQMDFIVEFEDIKNYNIYYHFFTSIFVIIP